MVVSAMEIDCNVSSSSMLSESDATVDADIVDMGVDEDEDADNGARRPPLGLGVDVDTTSASLSLSSESGALARHPPPSHVRSVGVLQSSNRHDRNLVWSRCRLAVCEVEYACGER